jgi:hypothetical protein
LTPRSYYGRLDTAQLALDAEISRGAADEILLKLIEANISTTGGMNRTVVYFLFSWLTL